MNAGNDLQKARRQAQENADSSGAPRYLHTWSGAYWISADRSDGSIETFSPQRRSGDSRRYAVWHEDAYGTRTSPERGLTRAAAIAFAEKSARFHCGLMPNKPRIEPMGGFGEGADTPRFDILIGANRVSSFVIIAERSPEE